MPTGVYIRINPPWNKGKKLSKKIRDKMSKSYRYHKTSGCFKKSNYPWGKGEKAPDWKGGRIYDGTGYIKIYKPDHPFRNKAGYIREHRLIIEKQIGRYLHCWEVVHHINKIRDDNRLENLILLKNKKVHMSIHNNEYFKPKFINPEDIIFDGKFFAKAKRMR